MDNRNELISLYENHIIMIWFSKFTPVIIVGSVGIKIIWELEKMRDQINPEWLFLTIITLLGLGIIGTTMNILLSFLNELLETKKKLRTVEAQEK